MSACSCCRGRIRAAPEFLDACINFTNPRRDEQEYCEICQVLVPHIVGRDVDDIHSRESVESLREELGGPGMEPRKIWRAIRKLEGDEWGWAYNDSAPCRTRTVEYYPRWGLNEEEMSYLEGFDSRSSRGDDYTDDLEVIRSLQQGGRLPDGSHLCWVNGKFFLDGLPIELPYRGMLKILERGVDLEGFDWSGVLLSLDLACCETHQKSGMRHFENVTLHPAAVLNWYEVRKRNQGVGHIRNFEMHMRVMGWGGGSGGAFRKVRAFKGLYNRLKWKERWDELQAANAIISLDEYKIPVTLRISNGRFQARVLRNHGWRWLEIESHPMTWSKMAMWALSPRDHPDFLRLMKIQQGVFSDSRNSLLSEEDMRGISLLRTVIESNSANVKVFTPEGAPGFFDVKGTSGLTYRIKPGMGAHNTRFSVHGIDERGAVESNSRDRGICIVEQRELRRYVIGDSVGMVVLTLLDDINSQKKIETLRDHMRLLLTRDQRESLGREVLMDLNRNDPAEAIVRRYTRLFPTLWRVILSRPLMSRMTFTAMNDDQPNISFEGCRTTFSTAGMAERRAIYGMLEASGWARDRQREQQQGVTRIYYRREIGEVELGNMVERFCDILEPFANGRVRLIPHPLWSYFERRNPLPGDILPEHNQALF
jgi:hypothetical protein